MLIYESIYQEDITIINISAPNIRKPKHMKQILTESKGETNSSIIVWDLNILLSTMDISSWQKISKETLGLNNTRDQMDPTD